MSPKNSIPQLTLISPCQADWDSMIGNDRIRFCEHCHLSVHNEAELTKKQLRRLVSRTHGRLCIRFVEPVVIRAQPAQALYKIGRRASAIAASAFSASLALSSGFASGADLKRIDSRPANVSAISLTKTPLVSASGTIKGCVYDPHHAAIPGANITLTFLESGEVYSVMSDDNGEFKFEGLKAGTYNLKVEATAFVTRVVTNIVMRNNDQRRIDSTLEIAAVTALAGAVAVASPTEPLVKAANDDYINALQYALRQKPDANVRDAATDMTALECAVRNGNREMMHVLLSAKADVNARDSSGQTVLMMLGETVTEEIIWDLLNAGARVNDRDNEGDTPLISVASISNVLVLKTLLDAGAKVNATNNEGRTALMMAAETGLVNNLRTLLNAGAAIDTRDKKDKTALMYAKENDHKPSVRLLKSFGAVEFEEPKIAKQ